MNLEPLDSLHIDSDPQARPLQRNSQGPVLAKLELMVQKQRVSQGIMVPVELYAWLLLHVGGARGVGAGGQRGRGVEARGHAQRASPYVRHHAHSRAARQGRDLDELAE